MDANPTQRRGAGILLHPTSLPAAGGKGELGPEAYRFVEFLAASGLSIWQTLPLGPPHGDGSPYQCLSAHAGNPALISLDVLRDEAWMQAGLPASALCCREERRDILEGARVGFLKNASGAERENFDIFHAEQAHWLDDYALYQALRKEHGNVPWTDWPPSLRDREPAVLAQARDHLYDSIAHTVFEQFVFFRQWRALKNHANRHGVLMFGDIPIFVAHDSADVWVKRHYFQLDATGQALYVAGVPPDLFAEDGQRWGNPLYDWDALQRDSFHYWIERVETQLRLNDLIRIDHFRGFEACWEIPAHEPTGRIGRWVPTPGDALLQTLQDRFGALPLVAEDLGYITPEVAALRDKYRLPGTKVLQFAFDGNPDNPYLPHNYSTHCVVYTGSHDNDTTVGWLGSLPEHTRAWLRDYLELGLESDSQLTLWSLIRYAFASVATLAIIPMQDILELGSDHRMNIPGTASGNWDWQFTWEQVAPDLSEKLRHLVHLYRRGG